MQNSTIRIEIEPFGYSHYSFLLFHGKSLHCKCTLRLT